MRGRTRGLALAFAAALAVTCVILAAATAAAQENGPYPDVRSDAYYAAAVRGLADKGVFAGTECEEGFCPDRPIDRSTMAVWTVRVLDGAEPVPVTSTRFTDVDASHPHSAFIERFAELGVTKGCGDGTEFCPDGTVIRAEMAVFLARAFNLDEGPDPGFGDVPSGAWYASEVASLAASGITKGCGDGSVFCPGRATRRAQMAAFLHRAVNRNVHHAGPPLVAIESAAPLVTSGNFEVTLRFSKPVTGLSRSEIIVVNGSAAGLTGSEALYTSRIEPAADGTVMVRLPAGVVKSGDGSLNEPSAALIRTIAPTARSDVPGFDTWNRPRVLQSADLEFTRSELDWGYTGNVSRCEPGTTSQAFRDSIIQRVSWYREMAGLDTVTEDPDLSASAQRAALIMVAQGALSHYPDSDWACYSEDGAAAAGRSNLGFSEGEIYSLGSGVYPAAGVNGIDGYMEDSGDNNRSVGHRRWILYPHTLEMGTGNARQPKRYVLAANALDVIGGDRLFHRPDVREERGFVSWPPSGYVPANAVWGRWSFSLAGADFSNATVAVADNSGAVRVEILHRGHSAGEPAIVWAVAGDINSNLLAAPTDGDHCYTVTVGGVSESGQTQTPYEYPVCVIDPDTPTGPSVAITSASPETVNKEFDAKITFSEPVTGFGRNEVFVVNGSVSAFTGGGREYTATVTPQGGGDILVTVGGGAIHDGQRLPNSPATPLIRQTDIGRPTVAITSSAPSVVDDSFQVTITFSEPVTATKAEESVIDQLSVVNGRVLDGYCTFPPDSFREFQECTARISPDDYGDVIVTVDSGVTHNPGGQPNRTSEPLIRAYAISPVGPPTVSLSSSAPAVVHASFDVLVSFSEPVTGLNDLSSLESTVNGVLLNEWCSSVSSAGDSCELQVVNGAIQQLVCDAWIEFRMCTATIEPDSTGDVTITINAGAVQDRSGETNTAPASLVRQSQISRPTVEITSSAPEVVTDSFDVRITFSEPVFGFEQEDLEVFNGIVTHFSGFGKDYTATITIDKDDPNVPIVLVQIHASVAHDRLDRSNKAAEPLVRFHTDPRGS